MKKFQLQGVDKAARKLGQQVVSAKSNSMKGLIRSAIIIQRSMNKEYPKVPARSRNLQASYFTTPLHPQIALRIGFTANYAVFVHENMNPDVNWNRKDSGPKFLESALERNGKTVLRTIAQANKL
jgi:hypothetical protein